MIQEFPKCYGVAGNHDLPYHRLQDVQRSAYWTLVKAGTVKHLNPDLYGLIHDNGLVLDGFSWGHERTIPKTKTKGGINVAVVHDYCWKKGLGDYPGVDREKHFAGQVQRFSAYDVVIFGDNHKPFVCQSTRPVVINCGGFMVSDSTEVGVHQPSAWLLYDNLSVERMRLDISQDQYNKPENRLGMVRGYEGADTVAFCKIIHSLKEHGIDYREEVIRMMETTNVHPKVKTLTMQHLGEEQ
jgi:predicted phosphodiesterase